jgi:hypothetical protein
VPCYRCGVRQVDPERGKSPWRRGVLRDHLVLVCPGCQASADWAAELEHCGRCGSAHLIKRLGQVECLDCGLARSASDSGSASGPEGGPAGAAGAGGTGGTGAGGPAGHREGDPAPPPGQRGSDPTLAAEVAHALDRVLGRR